MVDHAPGSVKGVMLPILSQPKGDEM